MTADPFTRWRDLVLSARSRRYEAGRDLAFWQTKAADYDDSQPALPNTVRWLSQQLRGAQSLLEVGAGTGRLLLPLAEGVPHVTALDYSPEMLARLQAKAPPPNVKTVCCPLQDAPAHVPPHDAALSAWSLAYQPDLRSALNTIRQLSRERFYLLEDDGIGSPHVQLRRSLAGNPKPGRATLLREALRALSWEYGVQHITEQRELILPNTPALLALTRLPLLENEVLDALEPYLTRQGAGWRYRWTFEVTVLTVSALIRADLGAVQ
ncbi:bifunctional 2-polyprenyl-6-hydroxyphenol methylase/3-demethylubiquinol 3-O-methyltransferase UbiG [Deinococcus sp.]|uniref:class I SAM-dependent methyltransferase n=1 Tax=Deinococcus sp. TaxID=47478 RepID=UPI0025BB2A8B|nr:class I SAM-dependent methyltransferase [Deinococcus sp.]